jgi:hypothetical protein
MLVSLSMPKLFFINYLLFTIVMDITISLEEKNIRNIIDLFDAGIVPELYKLVRKI